MDVTRLAKQLGITEGAVVRKARELAGLAAVRFPSMGQAEVCVAAVCLELACQALQHSSKELTRDKFVRYGCVGAKIYTSTFNMLHQALDVNRKIDMQHLVVQFGCTGIRQTIQRVLNLYKERFVAKLPDADKAKASFARPVFLASAFYLVARKHKIKVDLRSLLETLCVSRDDYLDISASMYQLCFDVVGVEKTKKKATERKTHTAVLDAHRHTDSKAAGSTSGASADEEDAGPSGKSEGEPQQVQKTKQGSAAAATSGANASTAVMGKPAAASRPKRARPADDGDEAWKLMALSGLAAQAPNTKPRSSSALLGLGELEVSGEEDEQEEEDEGLGRRASKRARGDGKKLKQSKLVLAERPGNTLQLSCK